MPVGQSAGMSSVGEPQVLFIGVDGNLQALNPRTYDGNEDMTQYWELDITTDIKSSPTLANGSVYLGYDFTNTKNFVKFDARDGTVEWGVELAEAVKSSATVNDGYVYVGDGDTNSSGNLYKLDGSDGSVVWSVNTGGVGRSKPLVTDGSVVVSFDSPDEAEIATPPEIGVFDAATGGVLWREYVNTVGFACDGSHVYAQASSTTVGAYSLSDGTAVDSLDFIDNDIVQPVYFNEVLYVATRSGNVFAVDVSDVARGVSSGMTLLWEYSVVSGTSEDLSPPLPYNGDVFVQSTDDEVLYAIDAESGSVSWSHLGSTIGTEMAPTAVGNLLYVVRPEKINVHDVRDGTVLFTHNIQGDAVVDPCSPAIGSPVADGYGPRSQLNIRTPVRTLAPQ